MLVLASCYTVLRAPLVAVLAFRGAGGQCGRSEYKSGHARRRRRRSNSAELKGATRSEGAGHEETDV